MLPGVNDQLPVRAQDRFVAPERMLVEFGNAQVAEDLPVRLYTDRGELAVDSSRYFGAGEDHSRDPIGM